MDFLQQLLPKQSQLLQKVVKGGAWLGVASVADQVLRFARNLLLARLLAPEAFGLMAIVLSSCALFQVLTGLGIKEAVIQNPRGAEKSFLNGAWWLAVARGLILYSLMIVAAPWIASFYNDAELTRLLHVAFINVLAQSCISAQAFIAVKEMRYAKWVIIQQGGGAIGICTTVLLAYEIGGVWALVIGYATEGVARLILSYIVCPFKPDFHFTRDNLRALLRFAGGMFGLPLLMLIYTEGPTFALGKMVSKSELGIFALAYTLGRIPTMFSGPLVDILLPAFSEMQKDSRKINQGIMKVTALAALIGMPGLCFVGIFGPQILMVCYGPAYVSGAISLTLLFANEVVVLSNVAIVGAYMSQGRPELIRRFSIIRASIVIVMLYPAISYFGIVGAAIAPLLAMLISYGFQLGTLRRLTGLNLRSYFEIWRRALIVALPCLLLWGSFVVCFRTLSPLILLVAVVFLTTFIALIIFASTIRDAAIRFIWPFQQQI